MSIPEAEKYVLPTTDAAHAYDVVNLIHGNRVKTLKDVLELSEEELIKIGSDYFTAGVAFLSNRSSDSHMEEVGTQAWTEVSKKRVQPVYATDIALAAAYFGVPPEFTAGINEGVPAVVIFGHTDPEKDLGLTFIPPEMLVQARNTPVDALGRMAYICSQIYDFSQGRSRIDPQSFENRANATEAQFLLGAQVTNPGIQFDATSKMVIARYPLGLRSLPPQLKYWGNPAQEAPTGRRN